MAKPNKRKEAIELRITKRLSIDAIAAELHVAKSSVSLWVREYPLTAEEVRKKCGYRYLSPVTLKCKVCGEGFESTNIRKLYCSSKCKEKYKTRKRQTGSETVVWWRQKVKAKAVEYKGSKCSVCGYDRCVRALKFHHLNPKQKDFTISSVTKSWDTIKKELDKCILVCGNCHDEIHEGLVDLTSYSPVA